MNETLTIDDLQFELHRSDRRSTVGITVERDGRLLLRAPIDCSLDAIAEAARRKQLWIYRKLARKQMLFHEAPQKEYVGGEGFLYLGRSYRLMFVEPPQPPSNTAPLRLHQGRFLLRRDHRHRAPELFAAWYRQHGTVWLKRRADLLAPRIQVVPGAIEVRDLRYRWGSCDSDGTLRFHWRVMQLPPRIVEYIVAHELVHLQVPHHGDDFWQRLARAMPDYASRKLWLAENGAKL